MPTNRTNKRTGRTEWYGKVTVAGKVYSKKCDSKRDALKWESLTREEVKTRTGTVSLAGLLNAHLDVVQARFSQSSYKDKARVFRQAVARFGADRDVTTISYRDIEKWTMQIKADVSAITANRAKVHMVAAWNWGIKALKLPEPCPWRVSKYKEESKEKYVPTDDEFWRVYEMGNGPERTMLLSFLHLAARKNEVFNLKWSDVDWDKNRIRVWTRKRDGGLEYDLLPMSQELKAALAEHRFVTWTMEHVFINPDTDGPYTWHGKFLPRLCKKAGVRVFGYHAIRHLAACLLDESGEPLAYIQAMLRHKNATTTSIYLRSLRGIRAPEKGAFDKKGARPGAQDFEEAAQLTATR